MYYVLFNPLSNNSRGEEDARRWAKDRKESYSFVSVIGLNYKEFFDTLKEDDEVTLCGGDGTINIFINEIYGYKFRNKLFFAKCGSGNDFYRDVEEYEKDGRVDLLPFIEHLPLVKVNGIEKRFINGIGYGIDGDTCLEGDKIKEVDPSAVIDYTKIAIGLLLGGFEIKSAKVTVDGVTKEFKNVWLSSTMNGKFYGGGMMAAPKQDRLNKEHTCTVTTLSSKGRIFTLLRFPSFSGGKHDGKKFITEIVGKHFIIEFDKPCALQIDGDVVKDVTKYEVICE